MSLFENKDYRWRETYFVLFDATRRPSTRQVKQALQRLGERFVVAHVRGDAEERFESASVIAPDDFAALDICYVDDEEVQEQAGQLADDMKSTAADAGEKEKIARIRRCDGRFDILHFEHVAAPDADGEEDEDEMLDPGAMLLVIESLARLTHGIAVDPQSGTIV